MQIKRWKRLGLLASVIWVIVSGLLASRNETWIAAGRLYCSFTTDPTCAGLVAHWDSSGLVRDHPDERDVPAQLRHLIVNREALARGQPRYMLEGIVNVVGDRHGRALPLSAQVGLKSGSGLVGLIKSGPLR